MGTIKEAELPGLGKKFVVQLDSGERLGIVIYDEGHRELFCFPPGEEEPSCSVTLTDQEARQVGAIVGGAAYQPKLLEKLEMAIADLHIEWLKVAANSPLVGTSIGELALRKRYGITVIAVIESAGGGRKRTAAINPGPNFVFGAGQTVVVAGRRDALEQFEKMAAGEGG